MSAAVRRWWWLPLVGALLGLSLGMLAGGNTTYTATALVESRVMGTEAQAVAQGAQAALSGIQTPEVFTRAATARKETAADLTARTRTAVVGDSAVISISVQAPTRAQAVADANALVDAAVAAREDRISADLTALRNKIMGLLNGSPIAILPKATTTGVEPAAQVPNGQAELSRQSALGQSLGEAQSAMITGQGRIRIMEKAGDATVARDVSKSVLLMATTAGLLLGLACALALGVRRDRIRTLAQTRTLYPGVSCVTSDELATLLETDLEDRRRVLVVGRDERATALAARIGALPQAAGLDVRTAQPESAVVDRLQRDPATLVVVDAPVGSRVSSMDRIGRSAAADTILVVGE